MVQTLCSMYYRIAGIFRGYKCLWFSADQASTANLILYACMLQKGCYSAKTFQRSFRESLYPRNNYTRYTVCDVQSLYTLTLIFIFYLHV